MAGKTGQKKRVWSDDEKRSICAQTRAEVVSVAQVARRYAMNTNLIHKWLRDPRFGAGPGDGVEMAEPPSFLPVEIEGTACPSLAVPTAPLSAQRETSRCRTGGVFWWKARQAYRRCWPWSKV